MHGRAARSQGGDREGHLRTDSEAWGLAGGVAAGEGEAETTAWGSGVLRGRGGATWWPG